MKIKRTVVSTLFFNFILLISILITACGRYGDPLSPELFAPSAIEELTTKADFSGITFTWRSPEKNVKGEELKEISGYNVYRLNLKPNKFSLYPTNNKNTTIQITDNFANYKLISTIKDTHIIQRDLLRKKAQSEQKVSRRMEVDENLKIFTFQDNKLKPGRSYYYKIVPFNQKNIEGAIKQLILVKFEGLLSSITIENL